jgi:hypothetical protein
LSGEGDPLTASQAESAASSTTNDEAGSDILQAVQQWGPFILPAHNPTDIIFVVFVAVTDDKQWLLQQV